MTKRRMTAEQIRTLVRARITKGAAFMMGHTEYQAEQERVKAMLDGMSIDEIKQAYPYHTYDIKVR